MIEIPKKGMPESCKVNIMRNILRIIILMIFIIIAITVGLYL
jgi:hypothetical protein